jgi:hypothetical protein
LRTDEYELIVAQEGNHILVVIYDGKLVAKETIGRGGEDVEDVEESRKSES